MRTKREVKEEIEQLQRAIDLLWDAEGPKPFDSAARKRRYRIRCSVAEEINILREELENTPEEPAPKPTFSDLANEITAYESGLLSEEGVHRLFERLVQTGMIYHLQGSYHRTAIRLGFKL